jgi:hypothetical protein
MKTLIERRSPRKWDPRNSKRKQLRNTDNDEALGKSDGLCRINFSAPVFKQSETKKRALYNMAMAAGKSVLAVSG